MRKIPNDQFIDLESRLYQLRSLGLAITYISTMKCQDPDPEVLPDLGRLVTGTIESSLTILEDLQSQDEPGVEALKVSGQDQGVGIADQIDSPVAVFGPDLGRQAS